MPRLMADVLRELHFDRGMPLADLARALRLRERSLRAMFMKLGFYHAPWTTAELRKLHRLYMAGEFASNLAKSRHRPVAELLAAWKKLRLPVRPKKGYTLPSRRLPDSLVHAMYQDYRAGMTFAAVERKHDRPVKSVRTLFVSRGLHVRESKGVSTFRRPDGSFAPYIPKTEEEIEAIILKATKVTVPEELRLDWRKWDLARRGDFIARLRARISGPNDRPDLPFSDNVEPFDYTSGKAWEIVHAKNGDSDSRRWKARILPSSQGVIFAGRLYFWNGIGNGYFEGCSWTRGHGRPSLHHVIWSLHHGRSVPPAHVVRHADGNPNNLAPSNLILRTRNDVIREAQAKTLLRKSRERTRLLLDLSQRKDKNHELIESLTQG